METVGSAFGVRFAVAGIVPTPDGRNPEIHELWFVRSGEEAPSLVMAYPCQAEANMIKELELVVLTRRLPELGLGAGDIGTVVLVHEGGRGFEVEFATLGGETYAVTTLAADQVRPIEPNEIAHARAVAAA